MIKISRVLLCAFLFWVVSSKVFAVDSLSMEVGNGDDATNMARLGLQWDWRKKWFTAGKWFLGGYWDTAIGYWDGDDHEDGSKNIADLGITPVFRLQQNNPGKIAPYFEAAIGLHLLSETSINDNRKFGGAFQFGDHLGVGIRFGAKGRYDLGYRFQHLSNGSIQEPDDGINFHQLRFSYHFD